MDCTNALEAIEVVKWTITPAIVITWIYLMYQKGDLRDHDGDPPPL